MNKNKETRVYPVCCQSASCGASGADCNEKCQFWRVLQEFNRWKSEHKAIRESEVWNPTVYTATI